MSTPEVTPDLLRTVAAAWEGNTASDDYARNELRARADSLERQQLPTVPGWYPGIVVERGGESCTGALLNGECWETCQRVGGRRTHNSCEPGVTVRWAERDGTTPGQTLWEAQGHRVAAWRFASPEVQGEWERMAAAVLAAHGTPTLTPVGESPEPGTRGLLPVVQGLAGWYCHATAVLFRVGDMGSVVSHTVLADPRPDGAL